VSAPDRRLLSELLRDLACGGAELAVLFLVVGDRVQEQDRLALRRAVVETEHREPADGLVVVVGRELVEQGPDVVDEPWVIAGEQLERDQRRTAAGRTLVLEPTPQELRLLAEPELPDRTVGDSTLAVVGRADRSLELVLPARPQVGQLTLGALARERIRLRGG
jgi:hypothetical protein